MSAKTTLIDRILQNKILSHLLFWVIFLLVTTVWGSVNYGSFSDNLIKNISLLPAQMMAAYTLIYYQMPRLFLNKKYLQFLLSIFLSIYFFSVIARWCIIYLAEPFIREDFEQESFFEIISEPFYLLLVYFPSVYMVGFIMLTIKSVKDRLEEKHQLDVLQKEKATTELKFLKAQIHPHFLFNTLNNLYALTLSKSDAAPEVVVKLSELLDYILYQCNEPKIEIHKEVELLKGYIELEMLRYGEHLDLTFDYQIDDDNTPIAPLILLSIVENAFKHGASGNPTSPIIKINMEVKNDKLDMEVFNTKPEIIFQKEKKKKRIGIGNTNLKRQLELNYPDCHQLEIKDTDDSYLVVLKIDLK